MEHKPAFSKKIDAGINKYGDALEDMVDSLRKKGTLQEVMSTLAHVGLIAYFCVFVAHRLEERERQRAWYSDGKLPYCDTSGLAQGTHCRMNWSKTGPGKLARWVQDEAGNLYTVLFKNKDGGDVAVKISPTKLEEMFTVLRSKDPATWKTTIKNVEK